MAQGATERRVQTAWLKTGGLPRLLAGHPHRQGGIVAGAGP